MFSNTQCVTDHAGQHHHMHDVAVLADEIKDLLARYGTMLKEADIRKEMRQLENWLETEEKGPAPACIISESGITWLTGLRDKLKLCAEETLRLEGEGGLPASKEQSKKTEDLLSTVRRIDTIIAENSNHLEKTH